MGPANSRHTVGEGGKSGWRQFFSLLFIFFSLQLKSQKVEKKEEEKRDRERRLRRDDTQRYQGTETDEWREGGLPSLFLPFSLFQPCSPSLIFRPARFSFPLPPYFLLSLAVSAFACFVSCVFLFPPFLVPTKAAAALPFHFSKFPPAASVYFGRKVWNRRREQNKRSATYSSRRRFCTLWHKRRRIEVEEQDYIDPVTEEEEEEEEEEEKSSGLVCQNFVPSSSSSSTFSPSPCSLHPAPRLLFAQGGIEGTKKFLLDLGSFPSSFPILSSSSSSCRIDLQGPSSTTISGRSESPSPPPSPYLLFLFFFRPLYLPVSPMYCSPELIWQVGREGRGGRGGDTVEAFPTEIEERRVSKIYQPSLLLRLKEVLL